MRVNQAIERRVLDAAEYIAATGATVRQAAKALGVPKSTVHKDMESRLPGLSPALRREVAAVFARNKAERHIRGGEATRRRYAGVPKEETIIGPAGHAPGRLEECSVWLK